MSDFLAFFIQRKSTDTDRKERALTKWSTRAHSRPASLLTFLNEGRTEAVPTFSEVESSSMNLPSPDLNYSRSSEASVSVEERRGKDKVRYASG